MSRQQPPLNTPGSGASGDAAGSAALRPDPRLDALLREALATGGLPPSVKGAQLAQLGLSGLSASVVRRERDAEPASGSRRSSNSRSTGTATTIGADDVAPGFSSAIVWEDRPRRRLSRFAMLSVAVSAVLVVVLLATLLPDGGNGNDTIASATSTPSSDLAASPLASATGAGTGSETATPAAEGTRETAPTASGRIYIVGERAAQGGTRGELVALDAASGAILFTLSLGTQIDAVVSSDGATIYVAWTPTEGGDDILAAYDALDGSQRWTQAVPDRVVLAQVEGAQPSSALLTGGSDDGSRRVALLTCPEAQCDANGVGLRSLRSFDGNNGTLLGEMPLSDCDGAVVQHLAVGSAVVVCTDGPPVRVRENGGVETLAQEGPLANGPPDAYVPGPADGSIYFLYGLNVIRVNSPTGMVIAEFTVSPEVVAAGPGAFIMPSSTGLRLFVGSVPGGSHQISVISTRTFDEDTRIATDPPLTAAIVAPGRDGRSLLGVSTTLEDGGAVREDAIVRYGLDGEAQVLLTLAGFKTQRLFTAVVPSANGGTSLDTLLALGAAGDGDMRLLGINLANGREVLNVPLGQNADAVLAPSGTSIYAASDDALFAIDFLTGEERWRIAWPARTALPMQRDSSALALSPDGTRLFVRSSAPRGPDTGDHFIAVFSAEDGSALGEIPNAGACDGRMHFSPDNRWLWIVCQGATPLQVINLETGEQTSVALPPGEVVASAVPRAGDLLHLLMLQDGMHVVHMFLMSGGPAPSTAGGVLGPAGVDPLRSLQLFAVEPGGNALLVGVGQESGAGAPRATGIAVQLRDPWAAGPLFALPFPVDAAGMVWSLSSHQAVVAGWVDGQTTIMRLRSDLSAVPTATTPVRLLRLVGVTDTPLGGRPAGVSCVASQPTMITYAYGNYTRVIPEYAGSGMALRLDQPSGFFAGGMLVTWQLDEPALITAQAIPLDMAGRTPLRLQHFIDQPLAAPSTTQRMVLDLPVGCWEIAANTPTASFRAVIQVNAAPAEVVLASEQLAAEERRAALTPYPVPDSCNTSESGLYLRLQAGTAPSWRFGAISLPTGVLAQGWNDVLFSDYGSVNMNLSAPPAATVMGSVDGGEPRALPVQHVALAAQVTYGEYTYHDWAAQLAFDTPGCWTLEITVGEFTDTTTVYVYPQTVDTLLTQRSIERTEAVAAPPATCAATEWAGPEWRVHADNASAYWLDGAGLALGTQLGTLNVGENAVEWLRVYDAGSDIPVDQPILLHGTRLDVDGEPTAVALLTDRWNIWPDGVVQHPSYDRAWRSTLSMPAAGCWQITARFGTQELNVVVWVPEAA